MDEELAELIGILLGDGSIGIYTSRAGKRILTQYRIKVTLNSIKDREYSFYVARLFEIVFGKSSRIRKRGDENAVDVYLLGERYLSYIIEIGMALAPKWERAVVPSRFMAAPLDKLVIRGYMDTDGCVCAVNNNGIRYPRIEMKISPSPMQAQLIGILSNNGFRPQVNRLEKGKVRVVLAGMGNLKRWNETIGFSNPRNQKMADSFLKAPPKQAL